MQFQDKNIVITGGASGIGLVVAKQLTQEGARVFLMSRNEQKPQQRWKYSALRRSSSFVM